MKIAFITGPFPVISKTFILDQITGLIDRSIDVDIFALNPGAMYSKHPDFDHYNLNDRIFYLNNRFIKTLKLFPTLFFSNIRKNPTSIFKAFNFFKYGKQALLLKHFYNIIPFLKNNYDIIHANFGPYGLQAQIFRELEAFDGKIVTSFHGFDMTSFVREKGKNVYQPLFDQGDMFLPISNYWENQLIDWGCSKEKIQVHHMGIKLDLFNPKPRRVIDKNNLVLLSVGRLIEKKGFKYSIEATKRLIKKGMNVSYTIIGDGPLKTSLGALINKMGLQNRVRLAGSKTRGEVIRYLEKSDIFILPSVTAQNGDMEGIPMVLMEAMATGIPIISTCYSGIPELIQDGITGFAVPEKDVISISEKTCQIISSPELLKKISREAFNQVKSNFNVDIQNDKLCQIYNNLMRK